MAWRRAAMLSTQVPLTGLVLLLFHALAHNAWRGASFVEGCVFGVVVTLPGAVRGWRNPRDELRTEADRFIAKGVLPESADARHELAIRLREERPDTLSLRPTAAVLAAVVVCVFLYAGAAGGRVRLAGAAVVAAFCLLFLLRVLVTRHRLARMARLLSAA